MTSPSRFDEINLTRRSPEGDSNETKCPRNTGHPSQKRKKSLSFSLKVGRRGRRNFNPALTAWYRSIHCIHHERNAIPKLWPLLLTEHDDRNLPARQILLISDVLVGRQEHVKTSRFCGTQQFPILKWLPTFLRGCANFMRLKVKADGNRHRLIE